MLKISNLTTSDTKRPLEGLTATFEGGNIYTILGRTGAGKTELLRSLVGLDEIDTGSLALDGNDLTQKPVRDRQMAMVYQQFINYPHLSVRDNVAFPLRRQGISAVAAREKADKALTLVGLSGFQDRMPPTLSGGQQQRVAIARAIVKQARILLMDEPLANLDYKLREQLRDEFPRLLIENQDSVILYTTTEPAEAMQLGHEVLIMHDGQILAKGNPINVYDHPATIEVAKLISDPPVSICKGCIEAGQLKLKDSRLLPVDHLQLPEDGPIQVGLRPDAFSIGGDISAMVELAEFSGSDTIIHITTPFGQAIMLVDGIHEFNPGQKLSVSLDTQRILLFSKDGENITERKQNG